MTAASSTNTAVLLAPDGTVAACYRKIHLFDVDLPGGVRFRESESIEPGSDVVVAPFPWGGLGLSICYDLRFPELYRRQTAAGAAARRPRTSRRSTRLSSGRRA